MTRGWCPVVLVLATAASAQPTLLEAPFGRSEGEVAPGVTFTASPRTGEETKLARTDVAFLGVPATRAEYVFWRHRLSEVSFQVRGEKFDEVVAAATKALGEPLRSEGQLGARERSWRAGPAFVHVAEREGRVEVVCSDRTQLELTWRDVLEPPMLAAIGTVIGLFVLLFAVVSLVTSWCPKCRSFAMKDAGRAIDSYTDVSPSPLSVDYRANVSFRYRCAKCGHQRTDRFDGFWSPRER
ncbi:MAG: hypothetical protein JNJ54_36665 [Myxococcaceae bacterium]|nr:hypothetical protein [Myxococcaceae bacterium]